MTQARSAQAIKRRGKTRSVTYNTDREDMHYLSTVCLTSSGTISIHAERLEISDARRMQNESMCARL